MMGFIYLIELGLGWLTFEGFAWETEQPTNRSGRDPGHADRFHIRWLERGTALAWLPSANDLPAA